jgi:hypothetical protein
MICARKQQLVAEQYWAGALIEVRVSQVSADLSGLRKLGRSQVKAEGRSQIIRLSKMA